MAQTLQQSLLLAKSMNGIISFDDGAGTTISNGQVITNGVDADNVNADAITTNTLTVPSLSLTNLTVTGVANLSTAQTTVQTMAIGTATQRAASTAFVNNYYNNRLTTANTWTNINQYDNPLCNIRSSWATGGDANLLYRNIGQTLTPLYYDPSTKIFDVRAEVYPLAIDNSGSIFRLDPSVNMLECALDLNNFYYDVTIGRDLTVTTGTTTLKNTICLSGNMDVPSPLSLATTTSIGPNTLSFCPSTAWGDDITAIGSGVLQVAANTHTGTTAIGRQAFGQVTNLGNFNTAIGFRAAYNVQNGANISNCTFIGPNTGVSNPISGTYTNSLAIGSSATITFSNQVVLGGSGLLVVIPSNLQLQSKFIERGSGTLYSAAFSMTVVPFTYYSINSVTPFSITLQAPVGTYLGTRCTFRRVSGDPNNAITSASANIYRFDSNTPTNELLPAGVYSCTICCMLISGTTYGWFQIETNETPSGAYVDLVSNQSISGIKTFVSPPVMSGASISSGTIPTTAISGGVMDLTTNQNALGIKTFNDGIVVSATKNLSLQGCLLSATQTYNTNNSVLSLTGAKMVYVTANTVTQLYLPLPTAADVGKIFTISKSGGATWGLALRRNVGTTFTIDYGGLATNEVYSMEVSEFTVDIMVMSSATSGVCYNVLYTTPTVFRNPIVYTSPFFLPPQSVIPATRSAINTIVIGQDALITVASGTHANSNTVIGAAAGKVIGSNPSALTIIGREAYGQATALGNGCVGVGYRCGYNLTTSASTNLTMIGTDTSALSATTAYTKSSCFGHGSTITRSNECVLATSTETVYVPGTFQVQNNYVASASPTLITTTTTLSGPVYQYYSLTSGTAYTITLPAASAAYLGCSISFRRVSGTITNVISSASSNIYLPNSFTTSTVLLDNGVCQTTIICMLLSATPTYGWFQFIF
jgi:hypothetical protein